MKIAFIVVKNIARGGGIEKYTMELGSRLAERGHEVSVFSMKHYGKVDAEYHKMRIITAPCLHGKILEKGTAAFTALCKSVIGYKFDILHFHTIPAGVWVGLAKSLGKKCVLQWHGLEWKRSRFGSLSTRIAFLLERRLMKQNISFTAVSRTQCDYFHARYAKHIEYIPTGAYVKSKILPQKIFEMGLEPQKYILFASRLVREKGAQHLIPAFRKLDTELKLVIAGDIRGEHAYKKELRTLVGGDPRILFLGFVQGRLLDELFGHASLYVQPSEIEGLSIALLEAMGYGCPCLVSDIPENLEAIGDVGWSFRNKDIDHLSERLNWMLKNTQILQSTKAGIIGRVRKQYSWDKITDDFEHLYERTLAN